MEKIDWNDKEVVLAAVSQSEYNLEYASERLRDDKEVVLAAVRGNTVFAPEYTGFERSVLYFASDRLRDDRELVMTAVEVNGAALGAASSRLRNDKEVVISAVEQNGLALQFASDRCKADVDVVKTAISQEPGSFGFADFSMRDNKDLALFTVINGGKLDDCSQRLRNDDEVVLAAVKERPNQIRHASDRILDSLKEFKGLDAELGKAFIAKQAKVAEKTVTCGSCGRSI